MPKNEEERLPEPPPLCRFEELARREDRLRKLSEQRRPEKRE